MEKVTVAIEQGKARGYDTTQIEDGVEFLYEYAIRRKGSIYIGYYFKVQVDRMSEFEDYAIEERQEFSALSEALAFIRARGGDVIYFAPFKGISPI